MNFGFVYLLLIAPGSGLKQSGETLIARDNPVQPVEMDRGGCADQSSQACQQGVLQTGSLNILQTSRKMKAAINAALTAVTNADNEAVRMGPVRHKIADVQAALDGQPAGGYPSVEVNLAKLSEVIAAVSDKLTELTAGIGELIPQLTDDTAQMAAKMQEVIEKITANFRASVDDFIKTETAVQKTDLNTTYTAFNDLLASEEVSLDESLTEVDHRLDVTSEGVSQFKNSTESMVADLTAMYKSLQATLKQFPRTAKSAINEQIAQSISQAKRRFNDSLTGELITLNSAAMAAAGRVGDAESSVAEHVVSTNEQLTALMNSVSANITTNMTTLRAAVMTALTSIAGGAASFGGNVSDTTTALAVSQNSSQARQSQAVTQLAAAVDKYLDLVNSNRIRTDAGTTLVYLKINEMLKTVQDAAINQSTTFAASASNDLLSQAGGLDDASTAFGASLKKSADASAGASADQKMAVAETNVLLYSTLADLLLELFDLSELVKAKLGANADSSDVALKALNAALSGGADDLSASLSEISQQQRRDADRNTAVLLDANEKAGASAAESIAATQRGIASAQAATNTVITDLTNTSSGAVDAIGNSVLSEATLLADTQLALSAEAAAVNASSATVALKSTELSDSLASMKNSTDALVSELVAGTDAALVANASASDLRIRLSASDLNRSLLAGYSAVTEYINQSSLETDNLYSDLINSMNISALGLLGYIDTAHQLAGHYTNATAAIHKASQAHLDAFALATALNLTNFTTSYVPDIVSGQLGVLLTSDLLSGYNDTASKAQSVLEDLLSRLFSDALNASDLLSQVNKSRLDVKQLQTDFSLFSHQQLEDVATLLGTVAEKKDQVVAAETASSQEVAEMKNRLDARLTSSAEETRAIVRSVVSDIGSKVNTIVRRLSVEDGNRVRAFISEIGRSEMTRRQGMMDEQQNQAQARNVLINKILSGFSYLVEKLLTAIATQGNQVNTPQIRTGNSVLSLLADCVGSYMEQQGKMTDTLRDRIASLHAVARSLDTSLQVYTEQMTSRLGREINQTRLAQNHQVQLVFQKQAGETRLLGNRLVQLIDAFQREDSGMHQELAGKRKQLLQLENLLKQLGEQGRTELLEIMDQINSGAITADAAIADLVDSHTDTGDIAHVVDAFMNAMTTEQTLVDQVLAQRGTDLLADHQRKAEKQLAFKETKLRAIVETGLGGALESDIEGVSGGVQSELTRLVQVSALVADQISVQPKSQSHAQIEQLLSSAQSALNQKHEETQAIIEDLKNSTAVYLSKMINQFITIHNISIY